MPCSPRLPIAALLGLLLWAFAGPGAARAQLGEGLPPGQVKDLFAMTIQGGDLYFPFSSAPGGGDPAPAEAGDRYLEYLIGAKVGLTAKIVVETICPDQQYALQVRAENFSTTLGGVAAGPVELVDGQPPADFIRDILPLSVRTSVELVYRAQVLTSQGPGRDDHTVTYTLIEQ